jgi:valyl-tRNA synthetase
LQQSKDESRLDRWIMSRLSNAVATADASISIYTFQQATTAIYNFWLYDLCDVYLEGIKPVMQQTGGRCILL